MVDTLQIRWPSGLLERYVQVTEINRTLDLTEGTAVAVALRPETGAIRPLHFRLEQSTPNPLRPEHGALIRYALPERKEVTITIYNLLGQKIVTLVNQAQPAGFHQVRWEGRNAAGFTAPAGLYFCVMRSGNFLARRKLVVLH